MEASDAIITLPRVTHGTNNVCSKNKLFGVRATIYLELISTNAKIIFLSAHTINLDSGWVK